MYLLVEYQVIDIESHELRIYKADTLQYQEALIHASVKKWRVMTVPELAKESDMRKHCGDGPGILLIVNI